jgi:aryl-alcohol dehydrogenase-like predicted oxidoreductase
MIRYNAAHRGAETEIFPMARRLGLPVIAYPALRWGALQRPTPSDPPGFVPPAAPLWHHFALQEPAVSVALAAPNSRAELETDLEVLSARGHCRRTRWTCFALMASASGDMPADSHSSGHNTELTAPDLPR